MEETEPFGGKDLIRVASMQSDLAETKDSV